MGKLALSENLESLHPPYVHFCRNVDPDLVERAIRNAHPKINIVELDGNSIPDLESLIVTFRQNLGVCVTHDKAGCAGLHWDRLDDMIGDIKAELYPGCVILIRNAEYALRGTKDGLASLGGLMFRAGDECAVLLVSP